VLPPIDNGFATDWIAPVCAREATTTPFTYNVSVAPLYVNATFVHAPTGLAVGPLSHCVLPPNVPPPAGSNGPLELLAFKKYASDSRWAIVRQPLWLAVGWIHADNVIPGVKANDGEAGTFTTLFEPLKLKAVPNLPGSQVPFVIVPVFPLPDASATEVPAPSPNEYAATSPVETEPAGVVTGTTDEYALTFPAASTAELDIVRRRGRQTGVSERAVAGVPTWASAGGAHTRRRR
jgi:hypothetical protein